MDIDLARHRLEQDPTQHNNLQQKALAGADGETAVQAINSLVDYTIEHFADEEELMNQIGIDGLNRHRWRNHSFVGKVADMALEWGHGNETSVDDILLFLKD